jgi:GAF domain-containing protein
MRHSEPQAPSQELRLRRLIEVGCGLMGQLDLEGVLRSVVEAAREVTGARYVALGVLDSERHEVEGFFYVGIDKETGQAIGDFPHGRGVLGELVRDPRPLRLREVEEHPRAYGFPPGHPEMHSFLGVPILIRGEAYGNLYLTEKQGAEEFDEADEEAAVILATWAGIAVENARLYTDLSAREAEVEAALRRAEAALDIALTVGGEIEVERVLDLIVKRARALIEARSLLVLLLEGDELLVVAAAGEVSATLAGLAVPYGRSVYGAAMREGRSRRLEGPAAEAEFALRKRLGAAGGLVVPLLFRGHGVGVLVATDPERDRTRFDREDQRLLESFAASAATAVATAQAVQSGRPRRGVA